MRRLRMGHVGNGVLATITVLGLAAAAFPTAAGAANSGGKAVAGCGAKAVTDPDRPEHGPQAGSVRFRRARTEAALAGDDA